MNLRNSKVNISRLVVGHLQTNCYIISTENKNGVIIDPGDELEKIISYVEKQKLNVRYIINTHGHCDHTGANNIKNRLKPVPLLGIHWKDEPYLTNASLNLSEISGIDSVPVKPDIHLEDNQTIMIDETISLLVIHTPGHTPGSISVKLNNYLFSGDLIFFQGIGRTDLPGGSEELMLRSLRKICFLDKKTLILPGHGPETTLENEIETNPFLVFSEQI